MQVLCLDPGFPLRIIGRLSSSHIQFIQGIHYIKVDAGRPGKSSAGHTSNIVCELYKYTNFKNVYFL